MKGRRTGSKTYIMLALFAVLIVSLGYLSMQCGGREGLEDKKKPAAAETEPKKTDDKKKLSLETAISAFKK